jgi:hypothetical protein
MPLNTAELLKQSRSQLNELFKKSPAGDIPNGEGTGTAIVCPGSIAAKLIAWLARWFLWQGKVFDAGRNCLVNRISLFSLRGIQARVYKDKSWFDGRECIVIDYSKTSYVAQAIRDEIREVAPGLYLGQVFVGASMTPSSDTRVDSISLRIVLSLSRRDGLGSQQRCASWPGAPLRYKTANATSRRFYARGGDKCP